VLVNQRVNRVDTVDKSLEANISYFPILTTVRVRFLTFEEGNEGVKWELGLAFLDWENGIYNAGIGT
jgi:hypothetical protein